MAVISRRAGVAKRGYDPFSLPKKTCSDPEVRKPIVDRMQGEVVKVLAIPEVATRLRDVGYEPVGSTPAQFGAYIKAEIAKWTKVIKGAGIKAE